MGETVPAESGPRETSPAMRSSREGARDSQIDAFDAARAALARAVRIDEVIDIRNFAEQIRLRGQQARDRSMVADAVELQYRTERKLGLLIVKAKEAGQLAEGRRPKNGSAEEPFPRVTLAEVGINKKLSMKAQGLARVTEIDFDAVIASARSKIVGGGAVVVNPVRDVSQKDKAKARADRERVLADKQKALPKGRWGVIYADPEWRFEPWSRESGMDRAADNHYPTSSIDAIKARPVDEIAADDAVLFLWATAPMLPQALEVMAAWGFAYKTHVIWRKSEGKPSKQHGHGALVLGTGYWFRNGHELLLVGTRGNVPAPAPGTQLPSMIDAAPLKHSEKPEAFHQLIETYFPNLPKIELNARTKRAGWDAWGNEASEDEIPAGSPAGDAGQPSMGQSATAQHPRLGPGPEEDTRESGPSEADVVASASEPIRHTKDTAKPILEAKYGNTPHEELAAELGVPVNTMRGWAFKLGMTNRARASARQSQRLAGGEGVERFKGKQQDPKRLAGGQSGGQGRGADA